MVGSNSSGTKITLELKDDAKEFAEADGGGLQRLDAARADQQVRLQGRCRQRDQVQTFHAAPDQCAGRGHRHTGAFARHREHAAVCDGGERFVEGFGNRHAAILGLGWQGAKRTGWALPGLPTLESGQELENNGSMPTLKEKLSTDQFVVTAEIAPPVSCDAVDRNGAL